MYTDFYKVVVVGGKRITVYDKTSEYLSPGSVGRHEMFYGHKGGRFVPGDFKISPCLHQSLVMQCSNGEGILRGAYGINRKIYGAVASFVYGEYGSPTIPPALNQVPYYRHVVEAVARSREGQMLIANTIAELPETVSMLTPAINAFKRKAKKLTPRRTLRRVGSALDYATSAWLSLRYGIIPTMNDIKAAMQIYDDKVERTELSGIIKSRAGETIQQPLLQRSFVRNAGPCYCSGIDQALTVVRWTATAYSRNRLTLARRLGVDLRSMLLSGYEGVPYSFVLDWAVDVGSWMAASIPTAEVMDLGNTLSSKKIISSKTWVNQIASYAGMEDAVPCNSLMEVSGTTYDRGCAIPIPALPQVNLDMSRLSRKLDALSLTWQQVSKELPKR